MNCPGCGSGAYVDGVCSTCGYQRRRDIAVKANRPGHRRTVKCRREHRWGKGVPTLVAGELRQRCENCRASRIVEASDAD